MILVEKGGNYAIPNIQITSDFETIYSIDNVADISKRKDSISKNISFPGTTNNDRIFNSIYNFNRECDQTLPETLFFNYNPLVGVSAILYENNYPLITGLLTIQEIKKDKTTGSFTATGTIKGNHFTLFGKLQQLYLTDLPIFLDVIWYDWQTITDSWNFDITRKYIFPQIDFGKGVVPSKTKFDYRNFRIGIYARRYIKSILASQGYKYKSSFIHSDLFNRVYIPFSEKDFGKTVFGTFLTATGGQRASNMGRNGHNDGHTGTYFTTI